MAEARLSTKGQVVIPKAIRERLNLKAGDRVDFALLDTGEVVMRPLSGRLTELRGLLAGQVKRRLTLEEMDQVISQQKVRRARAR